MTFYNKFFWLMPKGYRKWLTRKLKCAGYHSKPEVYGGFSIFFSIALGLIVFTMSLFFDFDNMRSAIFGLAGVAVFQFISISSIISAIDRRAKKTEEILPDALILMSSNIKSGLTPERALLMSAREEFGVLGDEIKKSAKRVIAGRTLQESIMMIPNNIESKILKRTIDLLDEGIKKGGSLVDLLDTLANDIRQTKILRKEIKSYVLMYVIFIFFAVGIGSPLLFAISSYLVNTMTEMSSVLAIGDSVSTIKGMKMVNFTIMDVDSNFLMTYSVLALMVNSIFGGMLIGVVQEGSTKGGLRYIPVLALVSIGIYFVVKTFVTSALAIF